MACKKVGSVNLILTVLFIGKHSTTFAYRAPYGQHKSNITWDKDNDN